VSAKSWALELPVECHLALKRALCALLTDVPKRRWLLQHADIDCMLAKDRSCDRCTGRSTQRIS
jgi:hypothetical protein